TSPWGRKRSADKLNLEFRLLRAAHGLEEHINSLLRTQASQESEPGQRRWNEGANRSLELSTVTREDHLPLGHTVQHRDLLYPRRHGDHAFRCLRCPPPGMRSLLDKERQRKERSQTTKTTILQ